MLKTGEVLRCLRFNGARISEQPSLSAAHKGQAGRRWTERETRKASYASADPSCGDRCVIQASTVHLPAIRSESRACTARLGARVRRPSGQPAMRAVAVVITLEIEKLHLQIGGRPEQRAVQVFAPDGADQPFNTWMRKRRVRDRLDFMDVQDPKIPLPLAEPIQRVMVRADVGWRSLAARRSIEHAAERNAVHDAAMRAKPHDTARELVHHDQHPVGPQDRRLAAKQVETPQTVLRVTEHGEPGRPSRVWLWPVPRGENAPHDILVDGDVERQTDLLRDAWTPPRRIALFHVDDGGHDVAARSPRARLLPYRGREQPAYFRVFSARCRRKSVAGFKTIAERTSRLGRMRSPHTPATTRSLRRRFGARFRVRLRMSNCCLRRTDSATTDR